MEHQMKLRSRPFSHIKSGKKTVELRLLDEKRRALKVGDTILFLNVGTGERLVAKIKNLQTFPDFFQLYEGFDKIAMGYDEGEVASAEDMYAYYSKEDIARYGVLAIEIELI